MINAVFTIFFVGIFSGTLGAILGIGGGMIITPIITIMLGYDIKYAIGASIVSVIATSSGATISYLKDDVLNLRVAMFLEIATTIGAIIGASFTNLFKPNILYFLFGSLLIFSSWNMYRKMKQTNHLKNLKSDFLAEKLKLNSSYFDKNTKKTVSYKIDHVLMGTSVMFGAGLASGMLGIGSGAFKVIAMDNIMNMPLKPSSATSNLMMGVTASASATIYFFNGSIKPEIAAPLVLGVLIGALIGSKIMPLLPNKTLRILFIPILLYLGLQMIFKALGSIL